MSSHTNSSEPTTSSSQSPDLEQQDHIWRALSDPSRRQILDLLRQSPKTTSALCNHFEFSRFAVMKHLRVLRDAGLLLVERRGRERINHLNAVPIQQIYRRWIKPFEALPADRLLRLKHVAEADRAAR